jgi:hypothetical protein
MYNQKKRRQDMKKVIFILMAICLIIAVPHIVSAAETLSFQWQQDVMVAGDKWEMHVSGTRGGPYTHLVDIPYVDAQSTYESEVKDIDIPAGGYYFVLKKVRAADGESSVWSNEVFYEIVNSPFQLKLIFGGK